MRREFSEVEEGLLPSCSKFVPVIPEQSEERKLYFVVIFLNLSAGNLRIYHKVEITFHRKHSRHGVIEPGPGRPSFLTHCPKLTLDKWATHFISPPVTSSQAISKAMSPARSFLNICSQMLVTAHGLTHRAWERASLFTQLFPLGQWILSKALCL